MTTGEAAPPFLQYVLVGLSANRPRDQNIVRSASGRLATRKEIWARSTHGIFNYIRYEGGQHQGYQ